MNVRRNGWFTTTLAVLVYAFMYAPIVVLIFFSFNESRTNVVFTGFVNRQPCGPFYWYCQLFNNSDVMEAARNTLIIAFTSTLTATIFGTMAALGLQRYAFFGKRAAEASIYTPIVSPEIQRRLWLAQRRAGAARRQPSFHGHDDHHRFTRGLQHALCDSDRARAPGGL